MPIYEYQCSLCNRRLDSLEGFETKTISIRCYCLKGEMECLYVRNDYVQGCNVGIQGEFHTPKRLLK